MNISGLNNLNMMDGFLTVIKLFPDGTAERVLDNEKNLIMLSSKLNILSSIYSTTYTPSPIATLQVGVGGTIDPQGLYPITIGQNNTTLYSSQISVPISYTLNLAVPSVTFLANLDQNTGNGLLITEAGLFCQNGSMFNQKTFPGISKTSEFALQFTWTIQLS